MGTPTPPWLGCFNEQPPFTAERPYASGINHQAFATRSFQRERTLLRSRNPVGLTEIDAVPPAQCTVTTDIQLAWEFNLYKYVSCKKRIIYICR